MKLCPLILTSLRLVVLQLGFLLCQSAVAAVTLSVTPPTITNDFTGKIVLNINGLSAGKTVRVEKYADLNGNGTIDTIDGLVETFTVTDGQLPMIGGIRNLNVPGDEDGVVNGQIRVELFHPWVDESLDNTAGNFIYKVSDPSAGFASVTQKVAVVQRVLPQGVNGTVTVAGAPQPYALVGLFPLNGPGARLTFADNLGRYLIYANPGSYAVAVLKDGFTADLAAGAVTINTNQIATVNSVLTVATIAVSGKLSDSASGAGLPGIGISAESKNNSFVVGFTDASGNYTLHVTPGQWKVKASKSQLAQVGYVAPQNVPTNVAGASVINFAAPKATALIYGRLKTGASAPLNGIDFQGSDQPGQYQAVGRSFFPNGSYALGVGAGTWNVGPSADDPGIAGLNIPGTNVTVSAGQAQLVDFTAQTATAHLRGRAMDNKGAPVAAISVFVNPTSGGPSSAQTTTGSDGSFDLGVVGGTWNLGFDNNGSASRGLVPPSLTVTVTDGVDQNNLSVVFQKVTAQISGSLTDNNRQPVAGINMYASANLNGTNYNANGTTDANGHYQLSVFNGSWQVGVSCNSSDTSGLAQRGYNCVGEQSATILGANQSVDFMATSFSAHLLGRVVDNTGAAVTFMNVFGFPAAGVFAQTTTDANGKFDLGLNGGQWMLQLNTDQNSGAPSRGLVSPSLSMMVVDGVNQSNIVLIAQNSTAQIAVSLKDNSNAPVSGVSIFANITMNGTNYTTGGATTDGSGNVTLKVFNGSWSVGVADFDVTSRGYAALADQTVTISGANKTATFILQPAGGSALQILTTSLPDGTVGLTYGQQLSASGNQGNVTWSVVASSGSLPPGLGMGSGGTISGPPTTAGTFNFTVMANDTASHTATQVLSIRINSGGGGADALFYGVSKSQRYTQNDANAPVLDGTTPYRFSAQVTGSASGTVSASTVSFGNGVIKTLTSSGSSGLKFQDDFSSSTLIDSSYPPGNYTMTINTVHDGTKTITLNLPASVYPNVLHVANFGAAQIVDPAAPFVVQWDPVVGGTTNDFVSLDVSDSTRSTTVFQTDQVWSTNALNGTATQAVIPANVLAPGTTYNAQVQIYKVPIRNLISYPGALGVTAFGVRTKFNLITIAGNLRLQIAQTAQGFRLAWDSIAGHTYQLQSSGNLVTWSDMGAPVSGTGSPLAFASALPNQGVLFFRVRAQ